MVQMSSMELTFTVSKFVPIVANFDSTNDVIGCRKKKNVQGYVANYGAICL